ncbi:MAG: DUF6531 domain-containing protein, partial [Anaerolineae bacterium]
MHPSRRSLFWLCVPLVGFLFLAFALDLAPSPRPVQASGVPTYYLDDDTYEIHLSHAQGDYWASGCFEAHTEAEVAAVVFRTSETGNCNTLKPRRGLYGGCSGEDLWPDTSDSLGDGGYYCSGGNQSAFEACQTVAPEATYLAHSNVPRPAGLLVRGGFQLGWSCAGEATVYDIRLVYHGIPPVLPPDQTNAPCDCPVGCTNQTQNWVGGPINTRTGNYHYSRQDISVAALGGPLRFERSYSSLETDLYTTPLGSGWTHNYDMDLTFPADPGGEPDTVIVKGCHGSRFRFGDNGDGTYASFPGVWATLTRTLTAPYTYTLTGVDQSLYVFDDGGRLVEVTNPQGQAIQLDYNGSQLARVQDSTGQRFLTFAYDGQGRLVEVRDPADRTVEYGYDLAGDLAVVTDTRDLAWSYTYTGTHLLRDVGDPLGHVVERTEYDGRGRAVRQWDGLLGQPLQIDYGADGTVTITDPLGHVTVDGYNAYGTLAWQSNAAGSWSRTYDAELNLRSTTDANGNKTRYVYNSMGQPEKITNPQDNTTRMAYDDRNHLTVLTDPLDHLTTLEYEGNLLVTITDALSGTVVNSYDDRGLLIQVVDLGIATAYGYDALGQRVVMTDSLGTVTTYGYDGVGRLITTTEAANTPQARMSINEYDDGDNLVRITQNFSPGQPQNHQDAYNLETRYEYDPVGNLAAITDTVGHVTRHWYDAANRLIRSTANYSPTVGPNHENQWNLTTQYGYDAVGNQTLVTDTLGHVTRNWYDDSNRLVRTTINYSASFGPNHENQWNNSTLYGYDAVGNQTRITDTLGYVTRYEYDTLNRLGAATDPLNGTTRYDYDELGRQRVVTDSAGIATYSDYDALGRLIETQDALNHVMQYDYDGPGHHVELTDATGTTTYLYDELYRPIAITSPLSGTVGYQYDPLGNRTHVVYPGGQVVTYTHDATGRLVQIEDWEGGLTGYSYDAAGRPLTTTLPNGIATSHGYDGA